MKTFGEWAEAFSASGVAKDARGDQSDYGNVAAAGLQGVVDSLRMLAEKNPQSYNFIVSKIRAEVQKIDPSAASSVAVGGRRYGQAVTGNQDATTALGAN